MPLSCVRCLDACVANEATEDIRPGYLYTTIITGINIPFEVDLLSRSRSSKPEILGLIVG